MQIVKQRYSEDEVRNNYKHLTNLLIKNGLTITTMESATSGQIASLITDTEGASSVLKGAFITYSNEAKIINGVPEETIKTYTVYSVETACAMADACQKVYNSDIAIGVTGTMGNIDNENLASSHPGRVYFAIKVNENILSYQVDVPPQPSRLMYKMVVAELVYEELINLL